MRKTANRITLWLASQCVNPSSLLRSEVLLSLNQSTCSLYLFFFKLSFFWVFFLVYFALITKSSFELDSGFACSYCGEFWLFVFFLFFLFMPFPLNCKACLWCWIEFLKGFLYFYLCSFL